LAAECRVFWRQHKPGSRRLVATTHVRGRCRCLRGRRRQRRCDCSLARCGGTRLRLARTGEQHQDENRKCRTKYDYFFHKLNCFFKKQFVASPIARRIKAKNSSFRRRWQSAIIWNVRHAERVCVSLFVLTLSIAASRTVAAGDWPQNYIVRNGSASPDGRYGGRCALKSTFSSSDENTEPVKYSGACAGSAATIRCFAKLSW